MRRYIGGGGTFLVFLSLLFLVPFVLAPGCSSAPEILFVDPNSGSTQGGEEVQIVGENFAQGATVRFGEDEAEIVSVTSTAIRVKTPQRLGKGGLVDVTVTNPPNNATTLEDAFRYYFAETTFATPVHIPVNGGAIWLDHGDFTGDGIEEIVIGGNSRVAIAKRNDDGGFTVNVFGAPTSFDGINRGEFNGDGKLDVVTSNWQGGTSYTIFLGNGDGTLQAGRTFAAGGRPVEVETGDLDGDGISDVAAGLHSEGKLSVALGRGDGTLASPSTYTVQSGPTHVLFADFNGDGKMDVAVANHSSGSISIFLGDGAGGLTFKAHKSAGGTGTYGIEAGDFNRDGNVDIAVSNAGNSTIGIFDGNGDGTFGNVRTFSSGGNSPNNLGTGDFDHDGIDDIAVINRGNNQIAYFEGKGDGTFAAPQTFATQSSPYKVTVGDFNGDGNLDIASANSGSSSVTVVLNTSQ